MPPPRRSSFRPFDDRPVTPKKRMMAQGRKTHFLYDLKQLLSHTTLDEARWRSFGETLFAKGARVSTDEAKAYLKEKVEDETITLEVAQAIENLVDRYSFWR